MTPADLAALHARCFTTPRPWGEAEFVDFLADPLAFLRILISAFNQPTQWRGRKYS